MPLFPASLKDASGIPLGGLWLPNGTWYALQAASAVSTDNGGLQSAPLAVGWFGANVYARASAAATTSGNSGDLATDSFSELAVDINITSVSGSSPTIQFFIDRKGNDGNYYQLYASSSLNATSTVSTSIGAGMTIATSFGTLMRLRWTITGTSPSFTFSASIIGKS